MTDPLRFVFGAHLHQPVGNFDHIFRDHVRDAYRPFLERTAAAGFGPLTLHVSGPIFDWLEEHDTGFVDLMGRLVSDGRLELLLAGFDEPILASLPRADRAEQIHRLHAYLRRRFGVDATGLWLTERVWEPELAADLADAGVGYALVDDRHFLATGFRREQLHQPWRTESDGRAISLLAIDERLRYLIPFRPPEETAAYLRQLRAEGHRLAVLADDGEKFGGWPGTREWVFEKGWLDRFLVAMAELTDAGDVRLVTGAEAVREVACGGLAYLPTASYREMEGWSLPAAAQTRLTAIETELGEERLRGPDGGLVRGGHWRNFLVKYAESNRMHKTMVALSALCRSRGDPPVARRAIGRAQCNDAYWHGVFGGLYLPILRNAIWHQLAIAESELRRGEPLELEVLDLDADGRDEIWIHSAAFSALVSPRRGGAIEVFSRFADGSNLADALTRRREAYHIDAVPTDLDDRAILVDRLWSGDAVHRSWATVAMSPATRLRRDEIDVVLSGGGLEKTLTFTAAGALRASYRWDPAGYPAGAVFATELSLSRDVAITAPHADVIRYPINTVAKSERGLEETLQGTAIVARWPASRGQAQLEIPAP